jgi:choline dehydrogenase
VADAYLHPVMDPTVPLSWTTQGTTDFRDIVATEEAALQWQQERRGP